MKSVLALVLITGTCISLTPTTSYARNEVVNDQFTFTQTDKTLHFVGSYALAFTTTAFFKSQGFSTPASVLLGSIVTFSLMSVKELYLDKQYSQGDQVGNALGVLTSAGLSFAIQF